MGSLRQITNLRWTQNVSPGHLLLISKQCKGLTKVLMKPSCALSFTDVMPFANSSLSSCPPLPIRTIRTISSQAPKRTISSQASIRTMSSQASIRTISSQRRDDLHTKALSEDSESVSCCTSLATHVTHSNRSQLHSVEEGKFISRV